MRISEFEKETGIINIFFASSASLSSLILFPIGLRFFLMLKKAIIEVQWAKNNNSNTF